jgi:hypothetical protein
VFIAGTALALAVVLALDITGHGAVARGVFTIAGLVFLILATFFPRWPRRLSRTDRRCEVTEHRPAHRHVPHPRDAVTVSGHWNDRLLAWMSDHVLASRVMFDIALIVPLIALPLSTSVKVTLGVISGSWIQWWALPSLQRSANIADAKREAKADADHEALTHIAMVTDQIHELVTALPRRPQPKTLIAKPPKEDA